LRKTSPPEAAGQPCAAACSHCFSTSH
jgi:hypothetical protein